MRRPDAGGWRPVLLIVIWAASALGQASCERDGGTSSAASAGAASRQSASQSGQGQQDGTVLMKIGGETFALEVAATPRARQIGLMHRKSMPQGRGMIFVFPEAEELGFWMKNTHIPLDIVYLDAGGKVVSIKQMKPLDESSVPSDAPAKYAIELNRGAAARAGVKVGDVLSIPPAARDTSR